MVHHADLQITTAHEMPLVCQKDACLNMMLPVYFEYE